MPEPRLNLPHALRQFADLPRAPGFAVEMVSMAPLTRTLARVWSKATDSASRTTRSPVQWEHKAVRRPASVTGRVTALLDQAVQPDAAQVVAPAVAVALIDRQAEQRRDRAGRGCGTSGQPEADDGEQGTHARGVAEPLGSELRSGVL